jgi:hypothetical protein
VAKLGAIVRGRLAAMKSFELVFIGFMLGVLANLTAHAIVNGNNNVQ